MSTSTHTKPAAHPTPRTYLKIAALLTSITAVEITIFYMDALKDILVPVFLLLSAVKFALVAMFYMHLKFDQRLFSALFVAGLLLASFLIIALMALFGA